MKSKKLDFETRLSLIMFVLPYLASSSGGAKRSAASDGAARFPNLVKPVWITTNDC